MKRGSAHRQIGGEYEAPAVSYHLTAAQLVFLGMVRLHAPLALHALRSDVLPHYSPDPSEHVQPDSDAGGPADGVAALSAWAERFHLADGWCLHAARLTLQVWRDAEDDPELAAWRAGLPAGEDGTPATLDSLTPFGIWHADPDLAESGVTWRLSDDLGLEADPSQAYPGAFPFRLPGLPPTPSDVSSLPPWDPALERWADYARGARTIFARELRAALQRYRVEAETWADAAGLVRAAEKRGRDGERHFRWLALYQCAGWSHARIAAKEHAGRKTVADAIHATAARLALAVRPKGTSGRTRNREDSGARTAAGHR